MYIEDIASAYKEEGLKFTVNDEEQSITFKMNTQLSPSVPFTARIINERTVLFTTHSPMNVPKEKREAVSSYLTRANYGLLVGNFEMDFYDGELNYTVAGCYEEGQSLSYEVIRRLTYVGFNMFDTYMSGVFAIIYAGKDPAEAYREVAEKRAARIRALEDADDSGQEDDLEEEE